MKNKSVIDEAIQQMQQKMADSRGQRTGEYRIGLYAAINILENLRDMHKEEIMTAHYAPEFGCFSKDYYNETFNTEEK
jgi:hypothetical protein